MTSASFYVEIGTRNLRLARPVPNAAMPSLEPLGATTASLLRSVVRRHAVRSDRSFPGFQLAATATHHVSLG